MEPRRVDGFPLPAAGGGSLRGSVRTADGGGGRGCCGDEAKLNSCIIRIALHQSTLRRRATTTFKMLSIIVCGLE